MLLSDLVRSKVIRSKNNLKIFSSLILKQVFGACSKLGVIHAEPRKEMYALELENKELNKKMNVNIHKHCISGVRRHYGNFQLLLKFFEQIRKFECVFAPFHSVSFCLIHMLQQAKQRSSERCVITCYCCCNTSQGISI